MTGRRPRTVITGGDGTITVFRYQAADLLTAGLIDRYEDSFATLLGVTLGDVERFLTN